ncbi:MAG: hypothetical protein HW380_653 [Magnetococcales bacterium]|nr:hypothetical protein [Magnetococcales bacterium]
MKELPVLQELYQAVSSDIHKGHLETRRIVGSVWMFPIRLLALLIFSPFITVGVIWKSGQTTRRIIALAGLLVAWVVVWGMGSWLVTWGAALLIMSHVSVIVGLGFIVGTYTSAILGVLAQLFLFNVITTLFLKMSSADVLTYLSQQMADNPMTSQDQPPRIPSVPEINILTENKSNPDTNHG